MNPPATTSGPMATSAPVTSSTLARNAGSSTVSASDCTITASLSGGARPASSSMSLAVQDSASLNVLMKPSSVVSAESSCRSMIPSASTAAPSHRAMTIHGLRALIRARFSVMDTVLCRLDRGRLRADVVAPCRKKRIRGASIRKNGVFPMSPVYSGQPQPTYTAPRLVVPGHPRSSSPASNTRLPRLRSGTSPSYRTPIRYPSGMDGDETHRRRVRTCPNRRPTMDSGSSPERRKRSPARSSPRLPRPRSGASPSCRTTLSSVLPDSDPVPRGRVGHALPPTKLNREGHAHKPYKPSWVPDRSRGRRVLAAGPPSPPSYRTPIRYQGTSRAHLSTNHTQPTGDTHTCAHKHRGSPIGVGEDECWQPDHPRLVSPDPDRGPHRLAGPRSPPSYRTPIRYPGDEQGTPFHQPHSTDRRHTHMNATNPPGSPIGVGEDEWRQPDHPRLVSPDPDRGPHRLAGLRSGTRGRAGHTFPPTTPI